jgi:aspartate/methionine/tyrosine aminotransferase
MDSIAQNLNALLDGCVAGRLLSDFGRRMYFPKGIIAQSAEAKKAAHTANATIGMAFKDGEPLIPSVLKELMPTLSPAEMVVYAPTAGLESVRELWKKLILQKNPSIQADSISLPAVVPGITAGLSYTADLFLNEGSVMLAGAPAWDNYKLIFEDRRGGIMQGIPFFGAETGKGDGSGGLDLPAITQAIRKEAKKGSVRIILNFPNNPSGYSPSKQEVDALVDCLYGVAEDGADILVLCDDAYFGLFYEEETCKESIFSRLCAAHERILAVKTDGPTKEDYSWGFRLAMLTFGSKGMNSEQNAALIQKIMGTIRSSVSCSATPSQNFWLRTFQSEKTATEKRAYFELFKRRYLAVKKIVAEHAGHPALAPLPFNSGYFMSLRCCGVNAEVLRQELLAKHGIGVISLGSDYVRLAFSSLEESQIPSVYKTVFETAAHLKN